MLLEETPLSPRPLGVRRPTRRSLLTAGGALAATGLTAGGLAGCSLSGTPRVTFYQAKQEAIPYFRDLTGEFNRSQSDYTYVHDISTKLSAAFVRRDPPDLGLLNYNHEMARFMERGAMSDLADLPAASRIREDVLELADWYPTYEGRTSVIPYSVAACSVIYNKRLFADHGVEIPTTWDEFIAVCETFMGTDITPIYCTLMDLWTVTQGLFDYTVGGLIDVREFYRAMNEIGEDVGPDSEVSFQNTMLEPIEQMISLLEFVNPDAASRSYADGNDAVAQEKAAMYFQGPWALVEIQKAGTDVELGTFPLPVTDDPDDLKVRVGVDLSLWIPEAANQPDGARLLLEHLMTPEVQNPYNDAFLAFGTTKDAPPVTDPRISEMQGYYDEGRFYMGPSQFIPLTVPYENYLQSIVLGADPKPILAQLDADWARLAYRA
ncbi:ABC transporter substrate-binding protein [Brachybacterium sp. GCM10030268]|uniref:ABC transporter substrate-binding protein n=1 Tax=Brachybacterium sp. GCM10030268 TaxID=3273382 RepID=UPI003617EF40